MNDKGSIRISSRIDNSNIDNDLRETKRKIDAFRKKEKQETEINGIKVTGVSSLTEEEIEEYNRLIDKYNELKRQKLELADVNEQLTESQETLLERGEQAGINNLLSNAEALKKTYSDMLNEFQTKGIDINSDKAREKLEDLEDRFNFIRQTLHDEYGVEIGDIKETENSVDNIRINVEEIKNALGGIGAGVQKTFKKVLKWGLAIFSVRSAYMFIRQAASTLSQYNDDLKAKIEGIRLALASSLEPIIKKIVDWVITLLKYVNAISMALFGWDLFKNAKNMKNMSKSAKEIKNSLAGFDEMNVLSSSSGSGAGAGGGFNYDDLYFGEGEEPWWIAWIRDNKDIIKEFLEFLLAFGIAFKALNLVKAFGDISKVLGGFSSLEIFGLIGAAAITLKGIYDLVDGIKKFIEEPSWENFSKILFGLSEILLGIGVAMAIIWGFNPATWIVLVIAAVALLVAALIKYWDEIKAGLKKAWDWIYKNFIQKVIDGFNSFIAPLKQVVKGIKQIFEGDLKGGLLSIVKGIANGMINVINLLIKGINKITTPIRGMIVAIGKVLGKNYTMSNIKIPEIPKLATGGIVNRPTLANLGEGGYKEAVLPLEQNTQWMDDLAKKINANGGVVNVYLDGRLIQRTYNKKEEEFNFATNGGI